MQAEDGSGKGAGLVSAIAQRINSRLACTEHELQNGNVMSSLVQEMKSFGKETAGSKEILSNGFHNSVANGRH